MSKKYIFKNSWAWLWIVAILYSLAFFAWYMDFSVAPFGMMASVGKGPFSFWELFIWTWEHFHFSWEDVLWIVIPSAPGFLAFAWRRRRLYFILPCLWLCLCIYYYFSGTFSGGISYLYFLRESPEYWEYLPWWFHILAHLSFLGYPVHP